jgi:hypothetical protein
MRTQPLGSHKIVLDPRRQLHRVVLVEDLRQGGIVTWETQQTDYPRTRWDMPNHEPRGCARRELQLNPLQRQHA